MDYRKEIQELRRTLTENGYLYYVLDAPTMSDYEYDHLLRRLEDLEAAHPEEITPDSPTQRVGGQTLTEFQQVTHAVPLESLQDVFDDEEVCRFLEKIPLEHPAYSVEPKVDGLSVALEYRDGVFVRGATRGDGRVGEDVTENLRTIRSIPMTLPEKLPRLIVRGEVYMARSVFEEINARREIEGKPLMANPRNAAAGSLRQLDPKIAAQRRLDIAVFNLQLAEGREFSTHTETIDYLASQHFKVIPHKRLSAPSDILAEIAALGDGREQFPFDIDGAVVKLDDLHDREVIGSTAKFPKWAIAYKYPPEEKESRLLNIELSVGRTGRITPTAVFEPVRLCGTSVSRATLHNQDFIDDLDIGIGDTIVVYKSGEIIPKIKEVKKEKRPSDWKRFVIPDVCPVCGAKTEREKDTADIRCTSPNCPAQLERHIINFVGRDAMDIKGFGTVYIEELVRLGYINNVADVFVLKTHRDELIDQGIIGKEKNTDKLLDAIEKSKENDAYKLLTGLGIPNVGKAAAKAIMKYFKDMDHLKEASVEQLTEVNDIGEVSALCIRNFFTDEKNIEILDRLKEYGVNMQAEETETVESVLTGKTVVVTGTLPTLGRKEASELIEKYGGKASGSVSKKTDYVLAGENAGSKLTKAQELGIPVISEEQLKEMLGI